MKRNLPCFFFLLFLFIVQFAFGQNEATIFYQRCLGGISAEWNIWSEKTFDGGFILTCGAASWDGDVTGNHGNYDYWLVKMDSAGTLQWEKSYGGSNEDITYSLKQ